MFFWIIVACLTLIACLAVLLPVLRVRDSVADDSAFDLEVYQDQLAELDRDVARGVIAGTEAEQARAEIARRILKLKAEGSTLAAKAGFGAGRIVLSVAILAVPLASWGIYAATGSPHLPSQPLHERMADNPQANPINELVARAEAHLAENPQDGRGWDVLAPIYYRNGRFVEAATAYRNAIRLLGASATREAGLGEAVAAVGGGLISEEAQAALQRALALEPDNPKARFLLALGLAQEGRTEEAQAAWLAMASDLPQDSPWRGAVAQMLGNKAEVQATPGPSQDDVDAAELMSDNERAEMIGNMVAGLDQRLRENPQDPEGWQRLIHAYTVLQRNEDARDALVRGLTALGSDSAEGAELKTFAAARGVSAAD